MSRSQPLVLLALPFLFACGGASTASPDGAMEASVQALRDNDIAGWIAISMSPQEQKEARASWEQQAKKPPTAEEREQFDSTMQMLTSKDAEKEIFALVQPQLAQMKVQWGGMMGFLPMAVGGMAGDNPAAKQAAQDLGTKLAALDIADEAKIKKAIAVATKTAQKLDVKDFAALQALSFDDLTGKGAVVLAGVKEVLTVYGLDLDATLDSVDAKVVSEKDDQAQLEVSYKLFGGAESKATMDMVKVDGRWAPKT